MHVYALVETCVTSNANSYMTSMTQVAFVPLEQ